MPRSKKDWNSTILVMAVALFSWLLVHFLQGQPSNWKPWAVPDLRQAPEYWTKLQLGRLRHDPALCRKVLEASGLKFTPIADVPSTVGCGLTGVVRYEHGHIPYSGSFLASCPLSAALYWYEQQLNLIAQKELGARISRIDIAGSYACRNVNSAKDGPRSEHATANAVDLTGFRISDGTHIDVKRDWNGGGKKAVFLKKARDEACRFFGTVLGPDYNALHANHFHLDMASSFICR